METQAEAKWQGARDEPSMSTRSLILVAIGLMASTFVGFVDQTIVSTAGPTIISDLGGLSLYAWVYSSFLIAATASMPVFGKISDRYGRKRFFIIGSLIFMGGSVLSGLAASIYQLIVFRAVQGLGAGAIVPILFGLVGATFPGRLVPRVQGLLFAIVGFATVIGPTIGSYLVEYVGWRWVFYFNLPVGILSVVLVFVGLKEPRDRVRKSAPIDLSGILTLLGWSVLLLFGILDGGSTFPWYSWQEGITFAAAAVLFFVFALIERTAADPIIPPSMLRIRTVSASLSVGLLRQTTFFAAIIYAPLFVQGALGGSVADGRNALYGLAIPFIVGSLISAQAITHGLGYRVTVMTGVVAMVLGTYFTTGLSSHSSILDVTVAVAPVGFGAGLTISATLSAIQNSVARGQIGVATSLLTFVLFLGSSIGLAALGSIQTNALSARLAGVELQPSAQGRAFVSGILANPSLLGNLLSTPQVTAQGIARYPALASLLPQLRDAFATSIVQVFWCVLGLLVVSLVCSFLITGSLRPRARPPQPTARRGKSPLHEEKTGAM